MKALTLKQTALPKLGDLAKARIKDGFWSLVKTSDNNGLSKIYLKSEKKTFELSEDGTIENIIENGAFTEPVIARLNFIQYNG